MKRREQALLLLRKAAQDEALLDEILASSAVSDEIVGFHLQQAFGAVYRYEDYDSELSLDRDTARQMIRGLRTWVESGLRDRQPDA